MTEHPTRLQAFATFIDDHVACRVRLYRIECCVSIFRQPETSPRLASCQNGPDIKQFCL